MSLKVTEKENIRSDFKSSKLFSENAKPAGDAFVWFTSVGLVLGLIMVVGLLSVIFVKGIEVFWPRKVVEVTLKDQSNISVGGAKNFFGIVSMNREKTVKQVQKNDMSVNKASETETQFFVGNKDVFGYSFIFIDDPYIESMTFPRDVVRVERLEYGDALAFPLHLAKKDGTVIAARTDVGFKEKLEGYTEEALDRWKTIKHIEKVKVGSINYKLQKLDLKKKRLLREGVSMQDPDMIKIEQDQMQLNNDYQVLAKEARELRNQQDEHIFTYLLSSGQEVSIPTGQIVDFYYPNQLNYFERVSRFFHRMGGFVTHDPREANTEGGVWPAIFGTFVMTVLMSLAVTPFGVIAAIYLREYAKQGFLVRSVRIAVNNLAGVPSIVFGVFGLGFFVYFVGSGIDHIFFKDSLPTPTFGTGGVLWASLTLALMTVPVVIVATEEALAAVPRGMREASLACGASKWQTIQRIILPAAAPGILTGLILAMARGAGEVAPLMLVGVVKFSPSLPIDGIFPFIHLEQKFMHLGFHIYDLGFQSPDSEAAKPMVFATTLLLIGLVVVFNFSAILIRNRLRKKYATGAF